MMTMTYLDHNATTPVRPGVADAVAEALSVTGNPSSVHRYGRTVRRMVEDAREQVAALVGATPAEVVFTSGGTEANALALCGGGERRVLVSAVEHPSVLKAVDGADIVPVDGDGVVDVVALDQMLGVVSGSVPEPAIVSVMLANNESGVVQPVAAVSDVARRHGARVHCDAVQAAGKIVIDVRDLDVDLLSLSAHKLGGPTGVGALIVRSDAGSTATLRGGGQERGRRAGTENVPGIVGFGVAAEAAGGDGANWTRIAAWRDALERRALACVPAACVFGAGAPRLPNTTCIAMPRVDSAIQVMALDLDGIAVSAGSACSSGKVTQSHVLAAMGVPDDVARTAIRVSLGWTSREDDVERFLAAWSALGGGRGGRGGQAEQTEQERAA